MGNNLVVETAQFKTVLQNCLLSSSTFQINYVTHMTVSKWKPCHSWMWSYVLEEESQILNDPIVHLLTRVPLPRVKEGKLNRGEDDFG